MTKLDVFNNALGSFGHDCTIPSIDSPMTENVRCLREWDGARRAVLSAHPWNWHIMQETPFVYGAFCDTDDYNTNAEYTYDRPADCIRLCDALDITLRKAKTRQANGLIYSLCPELKFRYLIDEEDPNEWPVHVRDAIISELAARIIPAMTANAKLHAAAANRAERSLAKAIEHDSKESAISGSDGTKYAKSRR